MAITTFGTTFAAVVLLLPALAFAAIALVGDAPGEWGRGALIAWTGVAAALVAGAGLQAGAGPVLWIIPALALAALMTGGPPGLVVAGVAVLALLALPGVPVPRWVVVALAVPALVVAARHYLG
jgi:hypothetical protein